MEKRVSFMDKEFGRLFPPEEHTAGVRIVDKLAKVHLNGGGENPETMSILTKEVEPLTGNNEPMGVIEILAEREIKKRLDKEKQLVKEQVTELVTEQVTERVTEQRNHTVVVNLLSANRFTVAEIANFASVTEAFVKKVRKELKAKK